MQRLRWCTVAALVGLAGLAWMLSGHSDGVTHAQSIRKPPPGVGRDPAPVAPGGRLGLGAVHSVHQKHHIAWIKKPGVAGIAIMEDPAKEGSFAIRIFTTGKNRPEIPKTLDGVPVYEQYMVEGFKAFQAIGPPPVRQTFLPRPVPIGVSVANQDTLDCYSGTLGCRLRTQQGDEFYTLSNNHVYALENAALIGDWMMQPSSGDSNCPLEIQDFTRIGPLVHFIPMDFSNGLNFFDAAIAQTSPALVRPSTLPDGYGAPTSNVVDAFIGQSVQKYGRTTGYTRGRVQFLFATINVGYGSGTGTFFGQIGASGDGFPNLGAPGDSGSLVVDAERNPVGLLFAGNPLVTYMNPIGPLLNFYDMRVDDGTPRVLPPPGKRLRPIRPAE